MSDLKPQIQTLLSQVRALIVAARRSASRAIDTLQVATNFEIGRLIVENEQGGDKRAQYGAALLQGLSKELAHEFGRGFSKRNLEYMRRFYLTYRDRQGAIAQTASAQSPATQIAQTASAQSIQPDGHHDRRWTVIDQGQGFMLETLHDVIRIRKTRVPTHPPINMACLCNLM